MGTPFSSSRACRVGVGALLLGFLPAGVRAQEATVTGVVVERTQSSWIGGATVRLSGSPPFFTDLDGAFQFTRVAPGRHSLTVQALGYQSVSMELVVRGDTALVIEMDPDPIVLDSLLVRSRNIRIQGRVFDALTGRKVPHAYVSVEPGLKSAEALDGYFIIRKVPTGQAATVLVEAVEYLPARIALITGADTTLTIELEPDSVGMILLAQKVKLLENRSNSLPYRRRVIRKEELERYPGWTIAEIVGRQLSMMSFGRSGRNRWQVNNDPACLFIDDRQQFHFAFLWGLSAGQVERVEVYDQGGMTRVYTKRYVLGLGARPLPSIFYSKGGLMGPICR
jgi:hypothetical protein